MNEIGTLRAEIAVHRNVSENLWRWIAKEEAEVKTLRAEIADRDATIKQLTERFAEADIAERKAIIKGLEKLLEEAEAVILPAAAMLGWTTEMDNAYAWIRSKNAYLAKHAAKKEEKYL